MKRLIVLAVLTGILLGIITTPRALFEQYALAVVTRMAAENNVLLSCPSLSITMVGLTSPRCIAQSANLPAPLEFTEVATHLGIAHLRPAFLFEASLLGGTVKGSYGLGGNVKLEGSGLLVNQFEPFSRYGFSEGIIESIEIQGIPGSTIEIVSTVKNLSRKKTNDPNLIIASLPIIQDGSLVSKITMGKTTKIEQMTFTSQLATITLAGEGSVDSFQSVISTNLTDQGVQLYGPLLPLLSNNTVGATERQFSLNVKRANTKFTVTRGKVS